MPLDLRHGLPGAQEFDDLGFEQADDALGERAVVRVTDAADGRVDAGVGQAFGVLDRHVLAAAVGMADQAAGARWCPLADSLVQGVQHEGRGHRGGRPPADNLSGKHVYNESHVHDALPCRDIGKVRDPELVRHFGSEGPVDLVVGTGLGGVRIGGDDLDTSGNLNFADFDRKISQ